MSTYERPIDFESEYWNIIEGNNFIEDVLMPIVREDGVYRLGRKALEAAHFPSPDRKAAYRDNLILTLENLYGVPAEHLEEYFTVDGYGD